MIPFLKPDIIYHTDVTRVKLDDLKNLNVEVLFLDLDNTIVPPKSARMDLPVQYWLEVMKKHFKIVVLTNNKKPNYLKACEELLEVPVIGFAHKPWNNGFKKALEIVREPHHKICIIGDRPLTDIWLAKRNNLKSILVKALLADIEPKWKFYLRKFEWSFIDRGGARIVEK